MITPFDDLARYLDLVDDGEVFANIKLVPERGTYLIVVAKRTGNDIMVLTFGEERTAHEAEAWLTATEKLMQETGREDVEAPDMHARKS